MVLTSVRMSHDHVCLVIIMLRQMPCNIRKIIICCPLNTKLAVRFAVTLLLSIHLSHKQQSHLGICLQANLCFGEHMQSWMQSWMPFTECCELASVHRRQLFDLQNLSSTFAKAVGDMPLN